MIWADPTSDNLIFYPTVQVSQRRPDTLASPGWLVSYKQGKEFFGNHSLNFFYPLEYKSLSSQRAAHAEITHISLHLTVCLLFI